MLRVLRLRLGLRRRNGNAEQPPLPAGVLEQEVEMDLQRSGREEAGEPQHAVAVEHGQGAELGSGEGDREQVEMAAAQVREAVGKIGGAVPGLEFRGGEVV